MQCVGQMKAQICTLKPCCHLHLSLSTNRSNLRRPTELLTQCPQDGGSRERGTKKPDSRHSGKGLGTPGRGGGRMGLLLIIMAWAMLGSFLVLLTQFLLLYHK